MPSLITDTIDEQLAVLVLAHPSRLASAVTDIFDESEFVVQEVTPEGFSDTMAQYAHQAWYKVLVVIEQTDLQKWIDWLQALPSEQQQFFQRAQIIFPLTTAVQTSDSLQDELAQAWQEVIEREKQLFSLFSSMSDQLSVIFYSDLTSPLSYPLMYLVGATDRGSVQDPQLSLGLLSLDGLQVQLRSVLFIPHQRTFHLLALQQESAVYVRRIQELYQTYFQHQLIIKTRALKKITHPVLSLIRGKIEEKIDKSTNNDNLSSIVKLLPPVSQSRQEEEKSPFIDQPNKQDRMRAWNTVAETPRPLVVEEPQQIEQLEPTQQPQPPVFETVNSVFTDYRRQQKQDHFEKLVTQTKKGTQKVKRRKVLFVGGLGVMGIGFGLIALLGLLSLQGSRLKAAFMAYLNSRSQPLTAQQKRLSSLAALNPWVSGQLQLVTSTFSLPIFSKLTTLSSVVHDLVTANTQMNEFVATTNQAYYQTVGKKSGSSLDTLTTLHVQADQLLKTISALLGELKDSQTDTLSPAEKQQLESYQKDIEQQQQALVRFNELYPLFPILLGSHERRTYAVILENEQELRPTGGFIQAVAFLTFQNGQLVAVQVKDIYQLDQQLTAFLEPPNEIKQFLGEQRWFIRDSNWDPNYPTSAQRIQGLLEKSTNQTLDGVIAMDLKTLRRMLVVLEQVNVPEYNEVLTERNLAERMEFYSEIQLVDQGDKPEYSALVLQKVFTQLQDLPEEKIVPLLSTLEKAADEKELLVYVSHQDEQASFDNLGWSGAIVDPTCPTLFTTSSCLVDSFFQVEANVGVNKANYYLQRQVDHTIQVLPNQILHKRVITFKNTAQTDAWPKGPYRSYTRFYVDAKAQLQQITVDGTVLQPNQITVGTDKNRVVWGILTETPVQKETTIELSYSLPHDSTKPFTYVFFDQKQPGARDVSPRIFMKFDPSLTPTLIAPQADVQGNVIIFNPSTDTGHLFVGATFK